MMHLEEIVELANFDVDLGLKFKIDKFFKAILWKM